MNHSLTIFTFFIILLFSSCTFADDFNDVYQNYIASQKNNTYKTTVKLAENLISLGEAKYGEKSESVINLQYNLAIAYSQNKRFQDAFDTMESVISDYQIRFGENSERVLIARLEQLSFSPKHLASSLKTQVKHKAQKAIDIANHLSEESKEKAPYIYYELSKAITHRSVMYHVKSAAIKYTKLAYSGLLSSVGKSDIRTLETQLMLASIHDSLRKKTELLSCTRILLLI